MSSDLAITRRTFLCGLTLAMSSVPLAAEAQQTGKVARVGFLHPGHPGEGRADVNASTTTFNVLRQSLRDLGWIEGKTVIFEPRYARDEANKLRIARSH